MAVDNRFYYIASDGQNNQLVFTPNSLKDFWAMNKLIADGQEGTMANDCLFARFRDGGIDRRSKLSVAALPCIK